MAKSTSSFAADQISVSKERALEVATGQGEQAPLLVEAWIAAGNAAAVQAVADAGQGTLRKAAKRGLNVLRARGVSVPVAVQKAPPSAASAAREAWLLPPDSSGTLGVVLAERQTGGAYQACFVYFRDGQNLVRVQTGELSLSKIKETMRQALGGAGYLPVSVPYAWAQYRVAERRAWHAARSTPEPLGMMGSERLLAGAPTDAPPHPFDEEGLELSADDAAKIAGESGVLHQWPEFRSWLPGERAVQELLVRLGRRLGPEPSSEKSDLEPLVREQVNAATDRYFTPERREVLARRMKDSALSVLARQGELAALQVAGVIQVIQGAGLITNPPSDVKFLTGYFDKALALLAARQGGQLRIPIPRAASTGAAAAEDESAPIVDDEIDPLDRGDAPSTAAAPAEG